MDDLDCFGVEQPDPVNSPLVLAFFWHTREDGWEKAMFAVKEECGCCGNRIKVGWVEMEGDAIRCSECVPPEQRSAP